MSDRIPLAEMERIMLEDPHIVAIHRDDPLEIPDIDLSLWEGDRGKDLEGIKRFLAMPYVEDDFGTKHNDRRKWMDDLERRYGEDFRTLLQ